MLVSLVAIGNSKGIRLPKTVIDQLNVEDTLELEIDDGKMVLTPIQSKARHGWNEFFAVMHQTKEDGLLDEAPIDSEAFEWEW